tara:strand:+ start:498 stop:686 length:189 start_codon:yes stop_codon:yes gene_type:complete
MNKEAVNQKAINVVTSCKTIPQLNVALNYIKLAKKITGYWQRYLLLDGWRNICYERFLRARC